MINLMSYYDVKYNILSNGVRYPKFCILIYSTIRHIIKQTHQDVFHNKNLDRYSISGKK